ncbi:hypothetical protein KIV45_12070 [Janthinobacterium lividum]|uniref:hypothetical protein n=1 Tax=Janthinobacterium sp. LB2P49 TaxID=3424198 RepID=UPI0021844F01|nr:hypothetical protein KIV45_12070 [Janthinobacterium lividum]
MATLARSLCRAGHRFGICPLFARAALRLAGRELACPVRVREAGQCAIGTALGLYFTAPVLAVLTIYTP